MAMKDLLHRFQPVQIYVVLVLSIVYFLVQLFFSHITHALTLLVDSYHMLCNIVALSGCLITIKHCNKSNNGSETNVSTLKKQKLDDCKFVEVVEQSNESHQHERSLRNTFGWTRIDILTMLIVCIFLAALCFSLLVEAVQTLIHIGHHDAMHYPIAVMSIGAVGLLLNGLCYLLIGGYTFHQGSFLHITSAGDVVLDHMITGSDALTTGQRRLSRTKREHTTTKDLPKTALPSTSTASPRQTNLFRGQSSMEMLRDISSTIFVLICAIIIYYTKNDNILKYVDPIISIISCITLLALSYPYMKESCLILLQTIPGSIDIKTFKADLLKSFEDIVNVHDLHIWQLSANKYVSTVHIMFKNPNVYAQIKDAVVTFFHDQGIQIVTIQPEFQLTSDKQDSSTKCLIGCQSVDCAPKTCCSTDELDTIVVKDSKKKKSKKSEESSKKAHSLLSLNVTSLSKLNGTHNKLNISTPEIITKSISETAMDRTSTDDETSRSRNISETNSAINIILKNSTENNLNEKISQRTSENGEDEDGTPANGKTKDLEEEVLLKPPVKNEIIVEKNVDTKPLPGPEQTTNESKQKT